MYFKGINKGLPVHRVLMGDCNLNASKIQTIDKSVKRKKMPTRSRNQRNNKELYNLIYKDILILYE